MPTYDYFCKDCGAKTEELQKITDAPLTKCAACGKEALQRGFGGGIGVSFSGTGFYETDYKNPPKKPEGSSSCCPCGKNQGSCGS